MKSTCYSPDFFMLKYYIGMILFLNVGHGISIRKCEYFGSMGLCLPGVCAVLVAGGDTELLIAVLCPATI